MNDKPKQGQVSFGKYCVLPSISFRAILYVAFCLAIGCLISIKKKDFILKQEMKFPIKNYEREAKSITMENISFLNYFAKIVLKISENSSLRLTSAVHFRTSKRFVHSNVLQKNIFSNSSHELVLFEQANIQTTTAFINLVFQGYASSFKLIALYGNPLIKEIEISVSSSLFLFMILLFIYYYNIIGDYVKSMFIFHPLPIICNFIIFTAIFVFPQFFDTYLPFANIFHYIMDVYKGLYHTIFLYLQIHIPTNRKILEKKNIWILFVFILYFILDCCLTHEERYKIYLKFNDIISFTFLLHEFLFWIIMLLGFFFIKASDVYENSKLNTLFYLCSSFIIMLHICWYFFPSVYFHLLFIVGDNITNCCLAFLISSSFSLFQDLPEAADEFIDENDI